MAARFKTIPIFAGKGKGISQNQRRSRTCDNHTF